ncbi:MAG: hypothetical protein AAGA54_03140 [Myxococcota bacterium]
MGRGGVAALGVLFACGCGSTPSPAPERSDDDQSGPATTSTTSGQPFATSFDDVPPGACERSSDCETEDAPLCAASYDPGTQTVGEGTCVTSCIRADDLSRFCVDDEGCCEGLSCNRVDGFCVGAAGTTSGTDGSTTGTDTDTDATSGSGGGTDTSGTSTSTGSGSSSGAARQP